MEGRPRITSGGDKLMANHGFNKSLFKINKLGWQLAAKWENGAIIPKHLKLFHVYIITVNGEMLRKVILLQFGIFLQFQLKSNACQLY